MASRASNLRSSIYLGADGRWHGYVTVGMRDDGSPDRRHRTAVTEIEVTRKVQELERKRDQGSAGKPGRPITVADWFDTWLTTIAPRTVSQSTIDSTYEPKVRQWIIPQLGQHRLDRLQPEHVDLFYTKLAAQGLKPNTIVQMHRIISRALKIAWKRGKVTVNVAAMVDAPIGEEVDIEPLTSEEARRILAVAAARRNGARWSVAFSVGIRQSEAIGLRWQFVDLDAGTIEVGWQLKRARFRHGCDDPAHCAAERHRRPCPKRCAKHKHRPDCPKGCVARGHRCPTVKRPCPPGCVGHSRECPERTGGGWHFSRRKGVKPGRGQAKLVLALPAPLITQLRAYRRHQAAERLAAGPAWEDWDLVFCTPIGMPIDSRDDRVEWHDLLFQAQVRPARVHDARHTAATLLLEQGIDIRVVQQILGHSQLSQTERYTHVTRALSQHAADRMSDALWGPSVGGPNDQGPTELQPKLQPKTIMKAKEAGKTAGHTQWGGWGSNPRPADYESAALTG